jgi:hypothetical protein
MLASGREKLAQGLRIHIFQKLNDAYDTTVWPQLETVKLHVWQLDQRPGVSRPRKLVPSDRQHFSFV